MLDTFCLYGILFFPSTLFLVLGLIYMFKKDWAWSITSSLLRSVNPQRTTQWEFYASINGGIMFIAGVAMMLFIIFKVGIPL